MEALERRFCGVRLRECTGEMRLKNVLRRCA